MKRIMKLRANGPALRLPGYLEDAAQASSESGTSEATDGDDL